MNEPKSLDEIKIIARNENNRDMYIAVVELCDYIERLELSLNNKNKEKDDKGRKKGI